MTTELDSLARARPAPAKAELFVERTILLCPDGTAAFAQQLRDELLKPGVLQLRAGALRVDRGLAPAHR